MGLISFDRVLLAVEGKVTTAKSAEFFSTEHLTYPGKSPLADSGVCTLLCTSTDLEISIGSLLFLLGVSFK
jgi:hypothetical protein